MTSPTSIEPSELPLVIQRYLAAHTARDTDAALQTFSTEAVIVDDGQTFRGREEIRDFLQNAGTQFTYTTELVGAEHVDDQRWIVRNHLEGDFPSGVVDLAYRFTIEGDLVTELVIGF